MNINELIDSDLLLINHDQKNLFIELVFLLSNKVRVKLFAFNKDTSTILVNLGSLLGLVSQPWMMFLA